MELMPSCTVPMFSNSADSSHMIHCDIPHKRSTSPVDTATAPMLAASLSQSQIASEVTLTSSRPLSMYSRKLTWVTRRICLYTVSIKPSMPSRA